MRARRTLSWIVCTAVLSLLLAQITEAQKGLRVDVDLVNIFPTVQNPGGGFVTGLTAEDFRVYEDGVEQKISNFETQNVSSVVGVLLDHHYVPIDIRRDLAFEGAQTVDRQRRSAIVQDDHGEALHAGAG